MMIAALIRDQMDDSLLIKGWHLSYLFVSCSIGGAYDSLYCWPPSSRFDKAIENLR